MQYYLFFKPNDCEDSKYIYIYICVHIMILYRLSFIVLWGITMGNVIVCTINLLWLADCHLQANSN